MEREWGGTAAAANIREGPRARRAAVRCVSIVIALVSLLVTLAVSSPAPASAAETPGSITGKVTSAATKASIEGIEVCAYPTEEIAEELFGNCTKTNPTGEYDLSSLPVGQYKVQFFTPRESGLNYIPQYYNDKPSYAEAEPVTVTSGGTREGVNAALSVGGQITGKVVAASTKAAIKGIEVCASAEGGGNCTSTNASGEYTVSGLPTGSYTVTFASPYESALNYLRQYYNGKASFGEADPVSVVAGSTKSEINVELVEGGQVTGRVTDASSKAAIKGVQVCAFERVGEGFGGFGQCARTNASGEYAIAGLATASYTVEFLAPYGSGLNYITQYYNGRASVGEADPVSVVAGGTKSEIDAELVEGGQITGKVTSAVTKAGISGVRVCASPVGGGISPPCVSTTSGGEYDLVGLATGEYKAQFFATSGNYIPQYYNGKSSAAEADAVSVTAGATKSGINAELVEGGQITGTVTGAATKAAIRGIQVCATVEGGGEFGGNCARTNANGEYDVAHLPSAGYTVEFVPPYGSGLNYLRQYYNGKASFGEADAVSVTAGATKSGIDAELVEGGQITGKVTSAVTKAEIAGVQVCASPVGGGISPPCVSTSSSGEYDLVGLATGEYKVSFSSNAANYVTQYYNGKASYAEAEAVLVTSGSTKSGIDAQLVEGGHITGKVTSAVTKAAIKGIQVCATAEGGGEFGGNCTTTNAKGEYDVTRLATAKYKVEFLPPYESALNYLRQYYSGKSTAAEALPVSVTAGVTTTGINAAMQAGGQITGKVTDVVTKAAISGIHVCASPTSGEFFSHCATTSASGEYDVVGMPTGEYRVEFSEGGTKYVTQYYNGKSSFSEAQLVSVTAGGTTIGIDAAMQLAGKIAGKVTSATTKAALGGIQVCAQPAGGGGGFGRCASTNASGEYTISGLAASEYKVEFAPPFQSALNYLRQYYNGKSSSAEANAVTVSAGATTSAIDAAMQEGGEVAGTVTDAATKAAIGGIRVCASHTSGEFFSHCTTTNASGEYTVPGLPTAQYRVEFSSPTGQYATQYYNGKTSSGEANPVSVSTGSTTPGINASLALSGMIHGTVTSAATKAPVAEIEVCARQSAGGAFVECATTNASGEYTVSRLPAGEYKVEFAPSFGSNKNYTTQYYNGKSSQAEANPVAVTAGGTTSGINAELHEGGQITGTVTDASTTKPIEGIQVCARKPTGEYVGHCASTNSSGVYTVTGVLTGEYRVEFANAGHNYLTQYYNNKTSFSEGGLVSVTTGATTPSINAAMQPGGRITGTVTGLVSKAPIAHIGVCASPHTGGVGACGSTNASGEYSIVGLPTAEYTVQFSGGGQNYITQYYNGKATSGEAQLVSVIAGSTTPSIDAAMEVGGEITGTVLTAKTKEPISGISVDAYTTSGLFVSGASTNANGEYTVVALPTGEFKVGFFSGTQEYRTQFYNNKESLSEATLVPATAGGHVTLNVDAALILAPPVLITAPSISGTDQEGHTLTEAHGSWKNKPAEFTYKWLQCNSLGMGCLSISGATEQTYVPVLADVGHTIRVEETAHNEGGASTPATSAPTEPIVVAPPENTKAPGISGIAQQGKTLTDIAGAWSNEPTKFKYQWLRCNEAGGECGAIKGATEVTYVPMASDVNHTLRVEETAENAAGPSSPATSAQTAVVVLPIPVNISPPTITGTAQQGKTLTEHHGAWEYSPTEFKYQWLQCDKLGNGCLPISGATGETYVPGPLEVGRTLRVEEAATNAGGTSPYVMSLPTAEVLPAPPVNISPPIISGTAQQGKTLTEHHGAWENNPTSYKLEWLRCDKEGAECAAISGEEGETYLATSLDVGHTIRVTEIAKNAGGPSEPSRSSQTAVVVPPAPVDKAPPTITGTAKQGNELTAHHGAWEYSPSSYEDKWLRCNTKGEGCAAIGATGEKYKLVTADVSHTIRVEEIATNEGGNSLPAISEHTGVVASATPENETPPTITGTAQQGQTLTAHHGAWTNEPTGYEDKWLRCNEAGEGCSSTGATGATYVPVGKDVGRTIRLEETASNEGGTSSSALSKPTAVVLPAPPVNLTKPTITGEAVQGKTLTEHHGSWENSPTSYKIRWLQCDSLGEGCLPISGATGATYTPVSGDVGHALRVEEFAYNAGGVSSPAESEATGPTAGALPVNTKPPAVEGTLQQGQTLTRMQGEWSNEPEGYEYQWLRCNEVGAECVKIAAATGTTYVPTGADVGFAIEVAETAHNATGGATKASAPTAKVIGLNPAPIEPPAIDGVAALGQVLTVKEGSWSNEPASISHQWLRCKPLGSPCEEVSGQTLETYPVGTGDIHEVLRLRETATTGSGAHASVETAPTAVVAPPEVKAVAGEDVSTVMGTAVHFDASATTPQYYISSYHWEFGDGTTGEGETATHAYAGAGTDTVKLTVYHGVELAGTSTLTVHVAEPPKSHVVQVTVVNAEGGAPIPGADVLYEAADGTRISGSTAENGVADVAGLPEGEDFIYAYHAGFAASATKVVVSHGEGVAHIELHPGAVKATLHSHELTLEEIKEHGINTNDPANRVVFEFSVHLAFRPRDYSGGGGGGGGGGVAEIHGYVNSDGQIFGGGPGCSGEGCSGPNWSVHSYVVEGEPVLEWMVFNGEASFLKQFFGVSMIVQNLSVHGAKFTNGRATLSLPPGLSLAPTAKPQTLANKMEDIEGEGSGETEWLVRGDKPGEYRPSATYAATLQPFNAPVELRAVLQEPIKVYGASAVKLGVDADEEANDTYPYHLHLILHNTSPVPVYNAEINLSPETHVNFLFQPQERLSRVVGDIPPGEKAETEDFILVPNISGELDVEKSFIIETAGEREERTNNVTKHPVVEPPSKAPEISAAGSQGKIVLSWAQVPGATGYRVFSTPNRLTPFGEPLGVHPFEHGTIGNGTVTEIPPEEGEAQLKAAVDAVPGEERWYAVSSIVNGIPTLFHPIIEATFNPGTPEVETGAVEKLEPTTATLTGKINPEGAKLTECRFEIGKEASHYEKQLPCTPPLNGSVQALTAPVTGLTQETTYHYRLAVDEGTTVLSGGDHTFKTPVPGPPTVETGETKGLTASGVTLTGTVSPNEATLTTCEFEYGIKAFTSKAPCSPTPTGGYSPVNVEAHITGITAGATYQYRLLATNPLGKGEGKTKTFQACDEKEAVIGKAQAIGCLITSNKLQYDAVGPVRVSGIDYTPEAGGKVTFDKTTNQMTLEGQVRVALGNVTLPLPSVGKRTISLSGTVFDVGLSKGQAKFFKSVPVTGDIKATLLHEFNDYGTKLQGEVSLQPFGAPVTGGLAITTFNKTGLSGFEAFVKPAHADPNLHQWERCNISFTYTGFNCKLSENPNTGQVGTYLVSQQPGLFKLGPLEVSDFLVGYDFAHHVFTAEATFSLGALLPQKIKLFGQQFEPAKTLPTVNVGTTIALNPFKIRKIKIGGQDLHWKLEPVHFEINEASFTLGFEPFQIGGNIKASVLKDLPLLKEGVQANAGFEFTQGTKSGFDVKVHGGPFQFWVLPHHRLDRGGPAQRNGEVRRRGKHQQEPRPGAARRERVGRRNLQTRNARATQGGRRTRGVRRQRARRWPDLRQGFRRLWRSPPLVLQRPDWHREAVERPTGIQRLRLQRPRNGDRWRGRAARRSPGCGNDSDRRPTRPLKGGDRRRRRDRAAQRGLDWARWRNAAHAKPGEQDHGRTRWTRARRDRSAQDVLHRGKAQGWRMAHCPRRQSHTADQGRRGRTTRAHQPDRDRHGNRLPPRPQVALQQPTRHQRPLRRRRRNGADDRRRQHRERPNRLHSLARPWRNPHDRRSDLQGRDTAGR